MAYNTRWSHRVAARVRSAIEAAIDRSELSVTQLADRTGIPLSTLRRRIQGINPWDIDQLEYVAEALGVDLDSFLSDPPLRAEAS
ncbi:helix-turn-helix domain-containing protein [Nocardia brasiliensis]|uniref:helix-turn-helix domain-containing protein n=1 Tax=Nocardia brasiliensis TaxID=37326 RepID=UPI002453A687|nr:helix-turn-helix transcriptional regulator [Nocardia brasiliensis]